MVAELSGQLFGRFGRVAGYFFALGAEERMEIVGTLALCRIPLPLSQFHDGREGRRQHIRHHLQILVQAGLVSTGREGRNTMVALNREELDRLFPGLVDALAEMHRP